jgi:hypothetical protein
MARFAHKSWSNSDPVDLVNSDLTDKLEVADLATISVLADILGVFDVCVVCIP